MTTTHDAQGHKLTRCERCDGIGYTGFGDDCHRCNGTGWIGGKPVFEVESYQHPPGPMLYLWQQCDGPFRDTGYPTQAEAVAAAVEALG